MLKISYTPSEYCFTPDLPTEIAISTDATAIDITVECDGNAAFTTTLYPYNNTATLYDIRSVIESYLLSRNLIFTRFVILAEVTDADGKITENTNTPERTVIFSRLNIGHNIASSFLQSSFLTTLSSFTIPRTAIQHLTYLVLPGCTLQCYTECLVLVDGESTPRTIRLTDQNIVTTNLTQLSSFHDNISPVGILSRLYIKGTLLQFTVHRGFLAKTFYVIDRTPNLTLQIRNEFNCFEHMHLSCVTKRKLSLDRSTATSLGTSTFYDDKSAYEYEVESSMLTEEESSHYSQLLLSPYTNIIEPNGGSIPIIITDISSEISDADNATNSLKFKYRYAAHRIPCSVKSQANIFDDPFHRTFD